MERIYKSTPAELARAKAYRLSHPEQTKAANLSWRKKTAASRQTPEWREKAREYYKEYSVKNRERLREKAREYEKNNREQVRASQKRHQLTEKYASTRVRLHLARKFKMTVEQYNAMLEAQGGVCKICSLKCGMRRKGRSIPVMPLSVDHDHVTGKIRGLLCGKCNSAIGFFRENTGIMEKAIAYLKGFDRGGH